MAGHSRSPSPHSGRRPSPPKRSRRDSPSHSRDRHRRRHDSRSPPPRRDGARASSPSQRGRYDNRSRKGQEEIEGIPFMIGESFSEYRTRVRNESTKTIWAPSPTRPTRSPTPEDTRHSKKKRSKKYDTDSESEDSSEEEERRRCRRHKKKHHKSSSGSSKHHKSSRHSSSSRRRKDKKRYSDESDEEHDRKKQVSTRHKDEKPVLEVDNSHLDAVEDLWVEKQVDLPDDLAPVGPVPLADNDTHDARAYGGALLPGEGSAMAAYVQQGKRIPRRGEIGLSGDQITEFEKSGYVMSGSRHQRMNAVRLRKENQVISAEEKRLVLQHAQEQKLKRENEIISGFREILSDKFKKEE